MADLATKYLGLTLSSPVVVSACTLSQNVSNIQQMEAAGAGAVVLYSLFEEQIELEEMGYSDYYKNNIDALPAALQSVAKMVEFKVGASGYLAHLYQAKRAVNMPIIASLNGYYSQGWINYARLLEAAGADALELNIYYLSTRAQVTASDVEKMYINLVSNIKKTIKIPVSIKLSPYFSAMANMAKQLDEAGANGLVLFNRFYQPDFDIEAEEVVSSLDLSTPEELRLRLRWAAVLYKHINAEMAITGGIHSAADMVKCLMAGGQVGMVASSLYKNGIDHIRTLNDDLSAWLDAHNYDSVDAVRGHLSLKEVGDSAAFERANYYRVISSYKHNDQAELPEE